MRKKVYLHIGRHKTGTTRIQSYLDSVFGIDKSDDSVSYPNIGRNLNMSAVDQRAHHGLAQILMMQRDVAKQKLADLRPSFIEETSRAEIIVFSSEAFQNVSNVDLISEFLDGFEINIICYLREYVSYVSSSYAQEVKRCNYSADIQFFEDAFQFDLKSFIDRWENIGHCKWRMYERLRFRDGDIVVDFLDSIGLTLQHYEQSDDENVSYSGNLLGFKLLLNILGLHNARHGPRLERLARQEKRFRGDLFVPSEIQDYFRAKNDCNSILNRMFGGIELKNFEGGNKVFDRKTMSDDLDIILEGMKGFDDISVNPLLRGIIGGRVSVDTIFNHPLVASFSRNF